LSKYVLFSPIGNHDPFGKTSNKITEGPLLHIVRHYKPEIVVLFLTKEMFDKEGKDNRYTNSIKHFLPNCTIEILNDGIEIVDAHKFDEFIEPYNGIFNKLHEKYPEYEIIFNVSSGTPQMISDIILEAQTSNIKTKAIQVITPERKANLPDSYQEDDIEYIENEMENNDNRCEEPNFNAFKKMRLKSQIIALINNYEYNAALNIIKNDDANLFSNSVINFIEHLHYRSIYDLQKARLYASKLENINKEVNKLTIVDKNIIEYFYTIKLKQKKGELDDMILKVTPFVAKILRNEVEKYYNLQDIISYYGKNNTEQITRETLEEKDKELLNFLDNGFDGYYNSGFVKSQVLKRILEYKKETIIFETEKEKNSFNQLNKLFNKFIDLESNIRNIVAHEMVCINEDILKKVYNGSSKDIVKDLITLLKLTNKFSGKFIFDEINKKLIELL
jgi:CRISPR type III-A/MTUBE-associated protein Csm6